MTNARSVRSARRVVSGLTGGAVALTSAVAFAAVTTVSAAAATVTLPHVVVVSHLNNPRQLDVVHDDALLIAEAGRGGTRKVVTDPEGGKQGLGYTGSVSLVLDPASAHGQRPHRVVTGLLSAGAAAGGTDPAGAFATGPDGVAARSLKRIAVQQTTFDPYTLPKAKALDGQLVLAKVNGGKRPFADISGYETAHDPDGYGVESNPYSVLNYRQGWLVADAAANTVYRVSSTGRISIFHVFHNVTTGPCAKAYDPKKPFRGCNFVPTSLATDDLGHVYVGGLSSLTPGQAKLVELDKDGKRLRTWGGFSAITGVAVGHDGAVYVSQLFAQQAAHPISKDITGQVTKVLGSTRTSVDVPFPAGLAVDSHDNLFVSAFSVAPAAGFGIPDHNTSGQVWRLRF